MPQKQQAAASGACQGELKNLVYSRLASGGCRFKEPWHTETLMTNRTPSMTHARHAVVDNTNIRTPGPRGPALLRTSGSSRRMAHSAVGKQAVLFVPTSAPTAYGVIE
jgi:hypothetical protein